MTSPQEKISAIAKITSRKTIFQGYHLLEDIIVVPKSLRHGGWAEPVSREVFHNKPVVSTILYLPETDELLLNQQFRMGAFLAGADDPFLFECSAGGIDEGESPEDAARREALEETGAVVDELEFICNSYSSPGCVAEKWYMYIGRVKKAEAGIFGLEHEGEEIKTHLLPASQVIRMLDEGHITNQATAMMLHWFARHREDLRKKWMEGQA